jgi:hypothetical protein
MARPGSTQTILGVTDIQDDVVCLPSGFRAVLEVDGVNFETRSLAERQHLLAGFARLLNGLEFRSQFLIRVRPLDIGDYLRQVEAHLPMLPPPLVLLALDHLAHVRALASTRRAMRQYGYLIVPAASARRPVEQRPAWRRLAARALGLPMPERPVDLAEARASLNVRCAELTRHLALAGLTARRLGWAELLALYHGCWNPGLADGDHLHDQVRDVTGLLAAHDHGPNGTTTLELEAGTAPAPAD